MHNAISESQLCKLQTDPCNDQPHTHILGSIHVPIGALDLDTGLLHNRPIAKPHS